MEPASDPDFEPVSDPALDAALDLASDPASDPASPSDGEHDTVDVWRVPVPAWRPMLGMLRALLAPGERARADRLRNPADAERAVISRGTLRRLLSSGLGVPPDGVELVEGPHGKPLLAGARGPRFNSSHAGDWIAHAISRAVDPGIDVERVRDDLARLDDFRAALTPFEYRRLAALPAAGRRDEMAAVWVAKEACLKSLGMGLHREPSSIEVSTPLDGSPWRAIDPSLGPGAAAWRLRPLDFGVGYAGCLAYRGADPTVRVRDYLP